MQGSDFQVPPPSLSLSLFPSYVMHELFEDSLQYQVFCLRVLIQTVPAKTYTRARARARAYACLRVHIRTTNFLIVYLEMCLCAVPPYNADIVSRRKSGLITESEK